jgi:N-acetylmuramoyl-L-alanine amidase
MSAALRMNDEKKYLIQELQQHGVHTILTRPEDLSINTLNKYLEFKARGMI